MKGVLVLNFPASGQTEASETEAEQGEGGGFRQCSLQRNLQVEIVRRVRFSDSLYGYFVAYTDGMDNPITELRQLLITSQQEQLKISRSLLEAQQAHTESVEASLRLNRRLMLAMAVLLAIIQ